jgi:NAD(P)-dependent dehydrogenase (short-subunit alcohol dehydrogenase family)
MHPAIQKGHVAVVTGAAMGIGYAIAERLAKEQMKVVLFDRDSEALEAAATALAASNSDVVVLPICGDVSVSTDLDDLCNQAFDFGTVSILVNNAAILKGAGPWENINQWRRLMEDNFWSVLSLQQKFVERMMVQGTPCAIVNVGSKEGITTRPGNAAYALSKAAVRVLTEQLAHELRERTSKVTAHLLIPGYTFTPMNFPDFAREAPKPSAPWTAAQVADRMVEAMSAGDFYLFCEDNEVTRTLDERRMQWSADDLIKNRPALSRWHPEYCKAFAKYAATGQA